ncbi:hypothetical protein ABIB44_003092 [Hymenobacter sp. UYCo722]
MSAFHLPSRTSCAVLVVLLLLLRTAGYGQGRHPKLLEAAAHGKYQPGWYTLQDGSRHAGKLRVWQTPSRNSLQVEQGKADPINLAPEQLRHFVMGRDSFIVARQVPLAGQPMTVPFGEADIYRVVMTGKFQVLQHDQLVADYRSGPAFAPGYAPGQYGGTHHNLAWVLRPAGQADLVVLPSEEKEFAREVPAFFIDNPALAQRIHAGLVGHPDFKRIVYAYVFHKDVEQVTYEEAGTIFH